MFPSRKKQVSRKGRQIGAWSLPKRNWNLTQELNKSSSNQVRNELKLLLVICVFAGSAPITVFPRYSSRSWIALQYCWLLGLYSWVCTTCYWELTHSTLNISSLEHKFLSIESLTYLLQVPCIMILCMRWQHKIQGVFDRIAHFDLVSGFVEESGSLRRFVRCQMWLMLIFIGFYIVNDYFYWQYNVLKTCMDLSTYMLPNILIYISIIPYFMLLRGIHRRLHCITDSLKGLLGSSLVQRAAVHHLRLQHVNLLHFTKAINQNFGVCILCVFVSAFFSVTTNLFLAYKNIEDPDVQNWAWWIDIMAFLSMYLSKMFMILYANHGVQQEQASCLNLLSKIRTQDEALIQTINHFVLQLQMDVRAFVVSGVIVLDYKFISALMMAITNTFIFILQYEITYQALSAVNETKT